MSKVKLCPYPFTRIQLNGNHAFIPCCSFWLKDEYYNIDPGENPWNGPQAIELRSRILKGDYSLCNRHLCHVPLMDIDEIEEKGEAIENETPFTKNIIQAIKDNNPVLPEGPPSVSIGGDRRCNLACPTCRTFRIKDLDDYQLNNTNYINRMISTFYLDNIKVFKIAAEGEPFYSPWYRELLKGAHPGNFPRIEFINLLTNGTLFTRKNFERLKPGTEYIKEISVSVDAGNEETYKKVRNFPWKTLLENLEFISELRQSGKINMFRILFVVRKTNYESMEDFIRLGDRLGVDVIHFSPFSKWPDTAINYEDEAIFLPEHPEQEKLVNVCERIKKLNNPKIRLDISY